MRAMLTFGLAIGFSACQAIDVGIWDNSRLYNSTFNAATGGAMTIFRSDWEARGAVWHQTSTLTAGFLSGVSVFFTSSMAMTTITAAEQTALTNWVKAGGTLFLTGEDSGHGSQGGYNGLLSPFGVSIAGSVSAGYGTILHYHPLLGSAGSIYLGGSGILTAPSEALSLVNDHTGQLAAVVLEYTKSVGNGRVFAIGDADMFTDTYMLIYEDNESLLKGIANWINNPSAVLRGHVDPELLLGSPAGLELTLRIEDSGFELESVTTQLDASGNYSVTVLTTGGPYDVFAKLPQWLGVKSSNTFINPGPNTLDWYLPYNGDATHNNKIETTDMNAVFINFGELAPNDADMDMDGQVLIKDLNMVFLNFGLVGE